MHLGISSRRAFVSGATRGIGLEIARSLAREGVSLYLVAREEDRLRSVATELKDEYAIRCEWSATDFRRAGDAARAAGEALDRLGGVDILINNAGRSLPGHIGTSAAEWQESYQLNFLSHLEVIHAVLPVMREAGWGRIVNIAGMHYRQPTSISLGTPAKFALLATCKVLSRDIASTGVTVNAVTVGFIESHQMNEIYLTDPEQRRQLAEREIPMKRFGQPDEVAAAVLFLVSEHAAYTTGSTITVDGGMTLNV